MRVGTLPDETRGIDANRRISREQAAAFGEKGFRFAVRYVRRAPVNTHDLTAGELADLLAGGLGVMAVQHVAAEDVWKPTAALGTQYGATAASECQGIGLPAGVTVWLDLEGVAAGTTAAAVIAYCNNWFDQVAHAGFEPGLYVGWHAGLNATQLYRNLRFTRYWAAYNLNVDQEPIVRGAQMRQGIATTADLLPGFTRQTLDTDVIRADAKGGTPTLVLP